MRGGWWMRFSAEAAALFFWIQTTTASSSQTTVVAFLSFAEWKTPKRRIIILRTQPKDDESHVVSSADTQDALVGKRLKLLSLQWTDPDQDPYYFSKTVTDVWRWKDSVLGDGRDFFVPKPQTLRALQSYIVKHSGVSECVLLSNCARFEIIMLASAELADPILMISSSLLNQVHSYQNRRFPWQTPLDWPGVIDQEAVHLTTTNSESLLLSNESANEDLSKHWTVLKGPRAIAEHLCLVAAGMAPRPRRPHREVRFRPFSSRDAHILLQLKRTLQLTHGGSLATLLRCAIQAGKAARNPEMVPILLELRNQYGETGNSKFDVEPSADVMRRVAEVRASHCV